MTEDLRPEKGTQFLGIVRSREALRFEGGAVALEKVEENWSIANEKMRGRPIE